MVNVNENDSNEIIKVLKGSIISIIATLILLIIFSIILTYTKVGENTIPIVVIIVTAFSILIGSQITTRIIKKNGILYGALVGAIYILVLYFISSIISKNFSINKYSIIMGITSLLIGGIGGVIGVNRK